MANHSHRLTVGEVSDNLGRAHVLNSIASEVSAEVTKRFALSSPQGRLAARLHDEANYVMVQASNVLWNEFGLTDPYLPIPPVHDGRLTPIPALPARGARGNSVRMTLEQHRALAERVHLLKTQCDSIVSWAASRRLTSTPRMETQARKARKTISELCSKLDDDWCDLYPCFPGQVVDFPYYGGRCGRVPGDRDDRSGS